MSRIHRVSEKRALVGECPLWHPVEKMLYWIDVQGPSLFRTDVDAGVTTRWPLPEKIGCIVWHVAGGLIGAMESGLYRLTILGDTLDITLHAEANLAPGMRFNDGCTSPDGRLFVGSMKDPIDGTTSGCLFRFDQDGFSEPLLAGLLVQNGVAWSPDGNTMYLSDAHRNVQKIWAFDYENAGGTISNQRLFVDMRQYPGRPDGATVDSEGSLWTAANDAGKLLRFSPRGALVSHVDLPVARPTMCAFGGPDLRTLFITTIGRDPATRQLSDNPDEGCLYALPCSVSGLPEKPLRY